jgi:Ca-activated chloride channel family protein
VIRDLDFSAPHRLWLLAFAVLLAAGYVAVQVVRARRAGRFASSPMLPRLTSGGAGRWRHVLPVLFVGVVVLASLGAAQPTVPGLQERKQATIVIAIDVSDSMGATDVAPTRIAAAAAAARDFVRDLPDGFDVGLVTAGASPTVMVKPTIDHGAVLDALGRLELSPGTALGDAIFTSLATLPRADPSTTATANPDGERAARIVLLSDGVTTTGRSDADAIAAAKEAKVPVSTIAFGTANASVVSQGQTVDVPVDATALQAIAKGTGGTFFQAVSEDELRQVYEDIGTRVGYETERREVSGRWLAGSTVLLVTALGLGLLWNGRLV